MSKRIRSFVELAAASGFYSVATFTVYWPAFLEPAGRLFNDSGRGQSGDGNLIVWILAWSARALSTSPSTLFDANIMHPAREILVRAEHLLGLQVFFAPIYLATENPILATQGTVFLTSVACGVSMYALLRHWGAFPLAALLSGFIYAFFPKRHFNPHIFNVSAVPYLPLVLLFLDRSLRRPRLRWAFALALVLLAQMLCSFYLAFMSAAFVGVYALAAIALRSRVQTRGIALSIGAMCAAVVALVAISEPYLRLAREAGGLPTRELWTLQIPVAHYWKTFLVSPLVPGIFGAFYVGLVPFALAIVALVAAWYSKARRGVAVPLLLALLGTYVLSFGPDPEAFFGLGMPYDWAYGWVPGFATIRNPQRFAIGVLAGVAALAGLGCHHLMVSVLRSRAAAVIGVTTLMLLVAFEFGLFHVRRGTREAPVGESVPPVYRALAAAPPGAVLEIPAGAKMSINQLIHESRYTMRSVYHWKPLINGYTGYSPPSHALLMRLARALPSAHAAQLFSRYADLRYIVVHRALLPRYQRFFWKAHPELRRIGVFGHDHLFEVPPRSKIDLDTAIANAKVRRETITGVPLTPLPIEQCRARVSLPWVLKKRFETRGVVIHGIVRLSLGLIVENLSPHAWPAFTTEPSAAVAVGYWWEDGHGKTIKVGDAQPLPHDLTPGQKMRAILSVSGPRQYGEYDLVVGLRQGEHWFPDTMRIPGVKVQPIQWPKKKEPAEEL